MPMSDPIGDDDRLDFTDATNICRDVMSRLDELQDIRPNIERNNKRLNAEMAAVNRQLLYLAHLANLLEVEIMNQYHRFKGENPPVIRAD